MAKIKTKDAVKGTIKQIDKAAIVGERMKSAYIATKEKAEHSTHAAENSAEEYAANRYENAADRIMHNGVHQLDKLGHKGVRETKDNIIKAKDGIRHLKETRAIKSMEKQMKTTAKTEKHGASDAAEKTIERSAENSTSGFVNITSERPVGNASEKTVIHPSRSFRNQTVKVPDKPKEGIRQAACFTGKNTIKTTSKTTVKGVQRSVKTAEQTAKTTIKTSQKVERAAQKTAKTTARASKEAAKTVSTGVKAVVKATAATIKAIIAGTKALIAAIAAGGWIAVIVIIVISLIALICGSVFGVFFSGEDSGTGQTMRTAVQEINSDYESKLTETKGQFTYDVLEISGSRAVWKDVLAVYAVKTNTGSDNPQEVATMDDTKKQLLKDIFWQMNAVSSRTETKTETEITETDDGYGNIIQTETEVTKTYLYITVSHKTIDEMAAQYGFNQEQKDYLSELIADENNSLWNSVLYGITTGDGEIVTVAISQIGNVGGQPYWSWYGFGGRVEWCACFVSWCANECGYIDSGVIPKYAGCVQGSNWFKERGQWAEKDITPEPGMIIFFDWNESGVGQDGSSDHTGIVEKVENGRVFTIEGNSNNAVQQNSYPIGYYEIYGYGVPA